jgi:hypothetical protein
LPGEICIVTVHGIGFQQPPHGTVPGYADALHDNLRAALGTRLGDDPEGRHRGPVYVRSEVNGSSDEGLARLDRGRPLTQSGEIAHVALVYSPSEQLAPRGGSVADTLARAILSHSHYASVLGETRVLIADVAALLGERHPQTATSSLRPRVDLPVARQHRLIARMVQREAGEAPTGALAIFRALEDDIATYVARNDLRERVRGFVEAALLALAARGDVAAFVVNAHSQGTVICWDVLCRLPLFSEPALRGRLRAFVTAGSPIRKYVDLFAWGELVGEMAALEPASFSWRNFWDPHDPVADPLDPPASWRPGTPPSEPGEREGLLLARDPAGGEARHMPISDTAVDNVHNSSGGGLQAHDYWNNLKEFIPGLVAALG